jgi:hypothetical protein
MLPLGIGLSFMFLQLAFPDAIYLVDAIDGGKVLIEACKPALESEFVTKVIHDGKRTFEVSDLFFSRRFLYLLKQFLSLRNNSWTVNLSPYKDIVGFYF